MMKKEKFELFDKVMETENKILALLDVISSVDELDVEIENVKFSVRIVSDFVDEMSEYVDELFELEREESNKNVEIEIKE